LALVSIVILTYNRKTTLVSLLDSLRELQDVAHEIIVVDNASEDGTDELVRARYPEVQYERTATNLGVAARNRGLQLARGDIIVTLDDDILGLTDGDLAYLWRLFAENDRLGAVCFKVTHFDNGRVCDWVHHRRLEDHSRSFLTYEITEGAVAFRREAIVAAGLYCEDFFISHEGLDLAYRLLNLGYDIRYDGEVTVRHKHVAAGRPGWRRYYFDTRNLFWVAARNQPFLYALRYLTLGLAAMGFYSLRDGFCLYWLRAVRDGLQRLPEMWRRRQPWTPRTREYCLAVDAEHPGFWYLAKRRIWQQDFKMD